jgi:hypothetical protein
MTTKAQTEKITATDVAEGRDPRWEALAARFPEDQIEKLPKQISKDDKDYGQCVQGSKYSADGVYCGKRHARSVHLDYVGHAGITMRLNEAVGPENWDWEPMVYHPSGAPFIDGGGMWITLTILGVTKKGYGDSAGKSGHNAIKEVIGDALRNAAMRFGVGTYLWSKSDHAASLHVDPDPESANAPQPSPQGNPEENRGARLLDEARARVLAAHTALIPDLSPSDRNAAIAKLIFEMGLNSGSVSDLNDLAKDLETPAETPQAPETVLGDRTNLDGAK